MINDRLPGVGDYDTPEQFVPRAAARARLGDLPDDERELGVTTRPTPSSSRRTRWSTPCARSAARGGNLLLNVVADGRRQPAAGADRAPRRDRRLDGQARRERSTTRRPGSRPGSSTVRRRARAIGSSSTCWRGRTRRVTVRGIPMRKRTRGARPRDRHGARPARAARSSTACSTPTRPASCRSACRSS